MILNLTVLLGFLLLLIFSISKWKVHPFIALILIAMGLGISMGMGGEKTVEVLLKGFSETLRWIAVIIILGAFIGEVLQGALIHMSVIGVQPVAADFSPPHKRLNIAQVDIKYADLCFIRAHDAGRKLLMILLRHNTPPGNKNAPPDAYAFVGALMR